MEERRCRAIQTNYERCNHTLWTEHAYCGVHLTTYNTRIERSGPPPTNRCPVYTSANNWCNRNLMEGSTLCDRHHMRRDEGRERREIKQERNVFVRQELERLHTHPVNIPWTQAVRDLVDRRSQIIDLATIERIARPYFIYREVNLFNQMGVRNSMRYVRRYLNWAWEREGPEHMPRVEEYNQPVLPPAATTQLARIARDNQNVHTNPVVQQTNQNLKKLLEVNDPVPADMDKIGITWIIYEVGSWKNVGETIDDMQRWYDVETCKSENDWLYRKALDGLYTYLKRLPKELEQELWRRFYEECMESVSMCCEGHLSRLANVMVGFDESFVPQQSVGEILQEKMAAINNSNSPLEWKLIAAKAVLLDLHIPEDQHRSWLDAIDGISEEDEHWMTDAAWVN